MVINENNSQINAFVKGMNSDTAYDQIENQQYVFGKNIRITKNDFIGGTSGNFPAVHEGVITPVPKGNKNTFGAVNGMFLGSDTINDIAVVITKWNIEGKSCLVVWRAKIDNDSENNRYTAGFTRWWYCKLNDAEKDNIVQVSTVAYQELEGVIKLYIATGVHPIIEIRIDGEDSPYLGEQDIDNFINNRRLPTSPISIQKIIGGQLKTSQVQYTYRYYNKFGTTTQLAPLTNKIQVIDSNRSKENGNAQDTVTAVGFTLQINNTDEFSAYKRLQIYRLSYIVPGEDAKVALIYDGDVVSQFNDVGADSLQEITMEEFAAMSGMVIIPKVIEQNQQYMFAANTQDDTIIQNVNYSNENIETIKTKVIISDSIDGVPTHSTANFSDPVVLKYLQDRNVNTDVIKNSYNNIFTSSLLRSLRRGEEYVYGIVYYDKYGRHTNVHEMTGVSIPEISTQEPSFQIENQKLVANVYGVKITLPQPDMDNIIGCQIVRRSSKPIYQKTLLQVALARPIKQDLYNIEIENRDAILDGWGAVGPSDAKKESPYYPTGFLWSDDTSVGPGMYFYNDEYLPWDIFRVDYTKNENTKTLYQKNHHFIAHSFDNKNLFQIFSAEIDFRRDDVLSKLKQSVLTALPIYFCNISNTSDSSAYNESIKRQLGGIQQTFNAVTPTGTNDNQSFRLPGFVYNGHVYRWSILQDGDTKSNQKLVFPLYYTIDSNRLEGFSVKSIKDVKLPQWSDGFSNLDPSAEDAEIAAGGIKKYKQFETNIDQFTFNNWISFALYDCKISQEDIQQNATAGGAAQFLSGAPRDVRNRNNSFYIFSSARLGFGERRGWIGPGTSCFLMTIDNDDDNALKTTFNQCWTAICNIQHNVDSVKSEPDEFIQYFGFGNFFRLSGSKNNYKVVHNDGSKDTTMIVFDGDIYITPHEISTMYKAYDFMSYDTLQSMQITNYVPLESKVNTFFDYGMNLLNTNSANLMTEPGSIDGITTQDRPVHQYNQIYSANDESNDVFTLVVEKSEDNNFKQRTYYSEPKINGEYVDNFVIFKPAAYIDVDPKYGEITNLLTDKNVLYYWQNTAFGKFSVNERSLINDTNGNTIMLGQAGILSRNDYISTKYGMRPYDYCAIGAENGVYWVDINNRAVVAGNSNECINFGERLNVQNIINQKIYVGTDRRPKVDYDLQNNELLCQCFDGEQIIFNLKLNVATSIYTRDYVDILSIRNHIYGYNSDSITRYNYLENPSSFLKPMEISIVVNPSASTTKVFDSQQLVPANRKPWSALNKEGQTTYFEDAQGTTSFETDINSTNNTIQPYTDREGNIIYNIPRFGQNDWGNRLRGKWMRSNFIFEMPTTFTTISHIITKFRQSYS